MNAFFKKTNFVLMAVITFFLLSPSFGAPWDNGSQKEIQWSNNLKKAQELSKKTGKPILLHFFSDTCPPCRMMEKNTFLNPAIIEAIQKSFIPVKLNANFSHREAQMFNVQSVPMDLVLSPNGQIIHASLGGQDASHYGHFLATAQANAQAMVRGNQANSDNNPKPPAAPSNIEAGGACPINETPSFNYAAIPEEDKARIEFEGYCPVELGQHSMWVRGDYNNRLVFEDRLYLFAGKSQLEEFRQNPEKYAPAYQGIDIVIWKERGEKVHGVRNYGAWAVGRVFLFSTEENLIKFEKNARYYITPNKN